MAKESFFIMSTSVQLSNWCHQNKKCLEWGAHQRTAAWCSWSASWRFCPCTMKPSRTVKVDQHSHECILSLGVNGLPSNSSSLSGAPICQYELKAELNIEIDKLIVWGSDKLIKLINNKCKWKMFKHITEKRCTCRNDEEAVTGLPCALTRRIYEPLTSSTSMFKACHIFINMLLSLHQLRKVG